MLINIPGVGQFGLGLGTAFSSLVAPGRVFFLNDQPTLAADDTASQALDPTTPAKTIAKAVAFCTANNGDTIVVGPKHSESLATLLAATLPAQTTILHTGLGISWQGTSLGGAASSLVADVGDSFTVKRAASILPASTTLNLFTILGGAIEIEAIEGLVTVVFPVTATLVKLTAVPTGLSPTDLCVNSASMANAAVGTILSITGTLADAMILSANQTHVAQAGKIIAYPGVIRVATTLTSATGQVSWYMRYKPLAPGAYAIAA